MAFCVTRRYDDLVAHLVRSTPLTPSEAARVVAEVVGYYGESVPDYVRRRHAELNTGAEQRPDLRRDRRGAAAAGLRAAALSTRQLRRLVYG